MLLKFQMQLKAIFTRRKKKRLAPKMKLPGKKIYGLVFLCLLIAGIIEAQAAVVRVFVTIAPQKYFVEKIGGGLVNVSVLVPTGANPHTYEPKPRQMVDLSKSALYFAVGIDLEKSWLKKITGTNFRLRIIRTDEGIEKITITGHSHNHSGEKLNRRNEAPDPHIWLSPKLVRIQAGHIKEALIAADPQNQAGYEERYGLFLQEIDELDAELTELFAAGKNKRFLTFHPSWGYFARDYGLIQVPIEMEGKEPKPAQLQRLVSQASRQGIKVVFVQPQLSDKSAALIAQAVKGEIIHVDPLAENWTDNLRKTGRLFVNSMK